MKSGKIINNLLKLGVALLLLVFLFSAWSLFSDYKYAARNALNSKKRIVISLSENKPQEAKPDMEVNPAGGAEGNNSSQEAAAGSGGMEGAVTNAAGESGTGGAAAEAAGGGIAGSGGAEEIKTELKPQEKSPAEEPKKEEPKKEETHATPAIKNSAAIAGAAGGAAGFGGALASAAPIPAPEMKKQPRIAIIITGLGLSKSTTAEAMKLPPAISFSFSPYSADLNEWFQIAKATGNEILLDLPMEPADYPITDPGPYALLTSLSKEENSARLKNLLAMAPGIKGLVASKDEKFTSSVDNFASIIGEIKDDNLRLYFASKNASSPVFAFSNSLDMPLFLADAIIDDKISEAAINQKLGELEKAALDKGFAIGIARPYPLSVKLLGYWIATLNDKGIKLVPASEIAAEIKK